MRLLLFAFVFFSASTYAQSVPSRNAVRVGLNRAFFGSGDVVGPALYAEYSYQATPFLAITPRLISGFAHREQQGNFRHVSSFAANVSVRITPVPRYLGWFSLDAGGLYHRFASTSGSVSRVFGYGSISSGEHYQENLWGFVGAINTDFAQGKQWALGARLELLTSLSEGYLNADSYQLGLYYGRRF